MAARIYRSSQHRIFVRIGNGFGIDRNSLHDTTKGTIISVMLLLPPTLSSSTTAHCSNSSLTFPPPYFHYVSTYQNNNTVEIQGTIPPGGILSRTQDREHTTNNTADAVINSTNTFCDIRVGQYAETQRTFSLRDVELYGALIRDWNPLHQMWMHDHHDVVITDDDENNTGSRSSGMIPSQVSPHIQQHPFRQAHHQDENFSLPLVHGMLVCSIFSSIFGTILPGAIYLTQQIKFCAPVYVNDTIAARVCVTNVRQHVLKRHGHHYHGWVIQCGTTAHHIPFATSSITEKSDPIMNSPDDNPSPILCLQGQAKIWIPQKSLHTLQKATCGNLAR
jgi:hypothetical protein